MTRMKTAKDIMNLWPSRADLASDIGVSVMAVHAYYKRNRLWPSTRDLKAMAAANERKLDISAHRLSVIRDGYK